MATTNQRNRSRGQQGSSGRQSPARRAASDAGQAMADMRDEVSGYISQGASQFRNMTEGHEGRSVLIALAAGFGVGLLVGGALASSHRRPRRWSDRIAAEGLGRRLMERVENMIPEAITERFSK
ncbi:MAG: hypothetical protein L0215_15965 [Gemmataceae bacterium]|nr:hypothetical protein [Gemmataceae bacterium]